MRKVIASVLITVLAAFALLGCSANPTASSMKKGLEKAGYDVEVFEKEGFEVIKALFSFQDTDLENVKTVMYAHKAEEGITDGLLLLIFESVKTVKYSPEAVGVLADFGTRYSLAGEKEIVGKYNNILWAGSSAAKKAAGIG